MMRMKEGWMPKTSLGAPWEEGELRRRACRSIATMWAGA
jgi:hypothetical protein